METNDLDLTKLGKKLDRASEFLNRDLGQGPVPLYRVDLVYMSRWQSEYVTFTPAQIPVILAAATNQALLESAAYWAKSAIKEIENGDAGMAKTMLNDLLREIDTHLIACAKKATKAGQQKVGE